MRSQGSLAADVAGRVGGRRTPGCPPRALVLIVALLAVACDRGAGAPGRPAFGARRFPVETATARPERLTYRIEAIGGLEAEEWVQVAAEVAGPLGPLDFKEGDKVGPDDVLAEVDPERYRLALQRAEAALARAIADAREKEASLEKRAELRSREQGWVPEEEIIRYQAQLDQARAAVAEARALRDIAQRDLARSQIRPPLAGVIERRDAQSGQYVQPGTLIATILKPKPLRVRFSLREEESARVQPGHRVAFTVPAYGDETFEAEIFYVARSADPKTRRVDVLARVPNEDERLKTGFFARVTVEVASREDAILLPEAAVRATEEGFIAYVVEDGKARRRLLEIGLQSPDGRIEVKKGVAPGDAVIVRGTGYVSDGVAVEVANARPIEGGAPAASPAGPTPSARAAAGS